MAIAATRPITAAEFAALDLDLPAELVRGEIIEMCRPGMRHGVVCRNLIVLLDAWSLSQKDPYLVVPEAGILTERDPDTVRGPDLYLIRRDRLPAGQVISGFLEIPPELCIEVFSPSDIWKQVISKVDEYLQAGVREVWVIEPEEREIYIYRPDGPPRTFADGSSISSAAVPGLTLSFSDVFRDVTTV